MRPQQRRLSKSISTLPCEENRSLHTSFSTRGRVDDIAWAQIGTTPIKKEGRVVGVLGVIMDITKRAQSEEALKESEKKYRTLFEDSRWYIYHRQNRDSD